MMDDGRCLDGEVGEFERIVAKKMAWLLYRYTETPACLVAQLPKSSTWTCACECECPVVYVSTCMYVLCAGVCGPRRLGECGREWVTVVMVIVVLVVGGSAVA